MTKSSMPAPRYSLWQAISAALALSMRAIEEVRALAREPGPQGARGERGRDGFSFKDWNVQSEDGGRKIIFTLAREGDAPERQEIKTDVVLDRGVYKPDQKYEKGDGVTFGGSFFIAQQDTETKPETGPEWRLAVKRGRDGRDGKAGEKGERGLEGKPGRDLKHG